MTALVFALGLTSCQSELAELTPSGGERITLSATQEDAAATRTHLNDSKQVVWSEGDALSVFDTQNKNRPFEIIEGIGKTQGKFEGTVTPSSVTEYYAVYPYGAGYTISSGTVTGVTLPAEQTAVASGFDKSAAIMTCHTTSGNLAFKQLCAFVQITTESATKKIVFKTNGSEKLAGTLSVAIDEEGIGTATVSSNGTGTVTLLPEGTATTIAAGTYLIAVLPGTLASGFTMECIGTDGNELIRSYNGSTSVLGRAAVINMGTASVAQGWTSQAYHECTHTYAPGAYAPTANNGTGEAGTDWVDLGITSGGKKLLFATRNLGAEHEYDYGDHYAWGATEPWCTGYDQNGTSVTVTSWKDGMSAGYAQANAPFYSSGTDGAAIYTKYTTAGDVLAAEDDAASVQWGADWRMPTTEEVMALFAVSTLKSATVGGVRGVTFTSTITGNSIFIPGNGYFSGADYNCSSNGFRLWTSTNKSTTLGYGWHCVYSSPTDEFKQYDRDRLRGYGIRPVYDPDI